MAFFSIITITLIPLIYGLFISHYYGKNGFFKLVSLFLILVSIWNIELGVLYASHFLSETKIYFLYKLFRFGYLFLLPTLFFITYVIYTEFVKKEKKNSFLSFILNKYIVFIVYIWAFCLYILGWYDYGIRGLKIITNTGSDRIYYPVYGTGVYLLNVHTWLTLLIIVLFFIVAIRIQKSYLRLSTLMFIIAYSISFLLSAINFSAKYFFISSQLSVALFSVFIFISYIVFNIKMMKEQNLMIEQNKKIEHVELITLGLINELKEPLINIQNKINDVKMNSATYNMENREVVKEIELAGDHAVKTVDSFGDFINSNQLVLSSINLIELIKDTLLLKNDLINSKNIQINVNTDSDVIYCNYDESKIKTMISNILQYSIDSVTDANYNKNNAININIQQDKYNIFIFIKDSGLGIKQEKWKIIFNPFETLKDSEVDLSLAISFRIAKAHNGNIVVLSSDEYGTTFMITLPLNVTSIL